MTIAPPGRSIRILAVDDHPLFRDGVAALLQPEADMSLVGEAHNGAEAIRLYRSLRPDITLMDLQMPDMGGVEVTATLCRDHPEARIIVLTTYSGDARAAAALKAGASGYLLKSAARRELVDVIRLVAQGGRHLPPEIATEIAFNAQAQDLSQREIDVLALVAVGQSNKRIAWALSIAEDTVKTHVKNIFTKLSVSDRTHAVTVAIRRGILGP